MTMTRKQLFTAAAALAFAAVSSAAAQAQTRTVVDVIKADPALTIFASALARSGLEQRLAGAGPFTVYAPTDTAIERMSFRTRQMLVEGTDQAALQRVVLSHVTSYDQQLYFGGGPLLHTATTLAGAPVRIERTEASSESGRMQGITLNGGQVSANLRASNGWVHYLDTVVIAAR